MESAESHIFRPVRRARPEAAWFQFFFFHAHWYLLFQPEGLRNIIYIYDPYQPESLPGEVVAAVSSYAPHVCSYNCKFGLINGPAQKPSDHSSCGFFCCAMAEIISRFFFSIFFILLYLLFSLERMILCTHSSPSQLLHTCFVKQWRNHCHTNFRFHSLSAKPVSELRSDLILLLNDYKRRGVINDYCYF